mgnify:CR=1 FL=1
MSITLDRIKPTNWFLRIMYKLAKLLPMTNEAKFKFEQDIVFNPKSELSYLYLSKIFFLTPLLEAKIIFIYDADYFLFVLNKAIINKFRYVVVCR